MFTKRKDLVEKKIDLANLRTKFDYEIKYLHEYLTFTSDLTEKKSEQLADALYKFTESDPDNENMIQSLFEREKYSLLSYYHHSAIVLIYSVLETILADICDTVCNEMHSKLSHNSLSGGNLISKSREYLQITTSLEFTLIEGEWARIGQFQMLRNVIVHQHSSFVGSIKEIDNQKNKIKNNFPSIKINDEHNRFYVIQDALVNEFLNLVERLICKIVNHVESMLFLVEKNKIVIPDDDIPF